MTLQEESECIVFGAGFEESDFCVLGFTFRRLNRFTCKFVHSHHQLPPSFPLDVGRKENPLRVLNALDRQCKKLTSFVPSMCKPQLIVVFTRCFAQVPSFLLHQNLLSPSRNNLNSSRSRNTDLLKPLPFSQTRKHFVFLPSHIKSNDLFSL